MSYRPDLKAEWRFKIPDDSELPFRIAIYSVVEGQEHGAAMCYATKQDMIDDLQYIVDMYKNTTNPHYWLKDKVEP
jgi:hypothetical protein